MEKRNMKIRVDWDTTDDEKPEGYSLKEVGLSRTVEVPDEIVAEEQEQAGVVADWLSDHYGWCVNGWAKA